MADIPILASSVSLLEKTQGFLPAALAYEASQFERRIAQLKKEKDPACRDMALLLHTRANEREAESRRVGDPWGGEFRQNAQAVAWQDMQRRDIEEAVRYFEEHGIQSLQIDIAVDPDTKSILVGYSSNEEELNAKDTAQASRLLNGSFGLADPAQKKDPIVCDNSVLYHAALTGVVSTDPSGKPILAEQEQIDLSLEHVESLLSERDIEVNVVPHDYAEVKPEEPEEATEVYTDVGAEPAPKPE